MPLNTLKQIIFIAACLLFYISARAIPVINTTVTPSNCKNGGVITVTATSTTGTVLYALIDPSQLTFPQQTSNTFSGLPSGSYTVAVYDGSTGSTPVTRTVSLTNNYTDPTISSASGGVVSTEASGYCGPQGTVIVSVSNGRAPFTFQLMDASGQTALRAPQASTILNGSSGTIANVPIGTYTVRVTDNCGTSIITGPQTVTQDNDVSNLTLSNLSISSTWAEQIRNNGTCNGLIAQSFVNMLVLTIRDAANNPVTINYKYLQGRFEAPAGSGNWSAWGALDGTLSIPYTYNGESFTVAMQVRNPCTGQTLSTTYTYPRLEYSFSTTTNTSVSTMCDPGKSLVVGYSGNLYNWNTKVCGPVTITLTEQGNPSNVKSYQWTSIGSSYSITDAVPGTAYNINTVDAAGVTRNYTYTFPIASRDALTMSTYVEPCDFNKIRFQFSGNSYSKGPFPITFTVLNGPSGTTGTTITANNTSDLNGNGNYIYSNPFYNMPFGAYVIRVGFGDPVCRADTITRTITQTYTGLQIKSLSYSSGTNGCGYYNIDESAQYTTVSGTANTSYQVYLYRGTTLLNSNYVGSPYSYSFTNMTAGTYTVKVYSYINISGGPGICSQPYDEQTITLPVYNLPVVNKQLSGGLVCTGQSTGQLHVSASGLSPIRFRVKPQGAADASYSAYQADSNFNSLAPGIYTVMVEDGCGGRITEDITLSSAATASFLQVIGGTPANAVCVGSPFSVSLTPIGTVSSITWTLPDGSNRTGVLNISGTYTPANAGTYSIQLTSSAGCSINSSIAVATAIQPTLAITDPASVCAGTSVNLAAPAVTAGSTNIATLNYYSNAAGTTLLGSTTVAPSVTTTYYIQGLSADNCSVINPVVVNIRPLPTVTKPSNVTVCNTLPVSTITLTGSAVPGTVYTWTGGADIGLADGSDASAIPSFNAINSGSTILTRTITVTPSANGCTGTPQTFNISVNPTPLVNQNSNFTVCNGSLGSAIALTGSPVSGTTYTWTGGSPVGISNGTGNVIPSFTATNTGSIASVATITVTPTANGCAGTSKTFTVTVNPTPSVDKPADITACKNTSVAAISLTGSAVAGTNYTWSGGNAVGLANGSGNTIPSFTAVNNGTSPLITTVTVQPSANGCNGASQTFTVTVNPGVSVNDPADIVKCHNETVAAIPLTGSAVAGISYSWTGGASIGLVDGSGTTIPSFTAINAGTSPVTANVTVTPSANGCAGTSQVFNITVNPLPSNTTIAVSPGISQLVLNKVVTLTAGTSGASSYQWYKNGVPISGAISPTYIINDYLPSSVGVYTVDAFSTFGCKNSVSGSINLPEVNKFDTWKLVADANGDNQPEGGEVLTYTIFVKNTGTVPINTVSIKDTIPEHTNYQSGGTYDPSDNSVAFTLTNLGVGQTANVSFTVVLDADITGVDSIYNHAFVIGDTIGHPTGCSESQPNGECNTPLPAKQVKAFATWKVVADDNGDGKASASEILTYTIHVKNTGSVIVDNVTITDVIPPNTTYVPNSAGGGSYNAGTQTITYTWPNLKVSQDTSVSFQVQVNSDITGVNIISNTATVTGDTATHISGCSEADVNGGCTTDIPTAGEKSFVAWKTGEDDNKDGKVQAGELINYNINVKNTGSLTIEQVTVKDRIPPYTSFVPGSSGSGIYNPADSTITFSWQNLKVGQDTIVSFTVMAANDFTGSDSIYNRALVTGDTINHPTGCSEANATDSCSTNIPIQLIKSFDTWKIAIDSSGNGLAEGGEVLTYTIYVKNTGNVVIDNTTIKDTIPHRTTFIESSAGTGTYNPADSSITYTITGLGVGQDTSVSFSVRLDKDVTLLDYVFNRAFVTGDTITHPTGCSELTAGDSCNTSIPIDKIKSILTWKTVSNDNGNSVAAAGDTLTYTIHVRNTGNVQVEQITVTDTIPAFTTYVDGSGGAYNSVDNDVTFIWDSLRVGQDTLVSFKVTINDDITNADTIRNVASVTADTLTVITGCSEANASDTCRTPIPVLKDQSFITWKTVSDENGNGIAEANELVTYTIHVKNTGSVIIHNVEIKDTLPTNIIMVNSGGGTYDPVNRAISFTMQNVAVGLDTSVTIKVRLSNDLTGLDTLRNRAIVIGDTITHHTGCSEAAANDSCDTKIPASVIKSFDTWKLVVEGNPNDLPDSSEIFIYTIHVKNTGNVMIENVTVTDTVPLHTSYVLGSGGLYSPDTRTVSFNWPNLRVGQDTSVVFRIKVDADVTQADTIRNSAHVTGDTISHETGCSESNPNGACPTIVPVYKISSFKAWKEVQDANHDGLAQAGEILTYTIHVKNTGNVLINDLQVFDTIPAYTSFVSAEGAVYDATTRFVLFDTSSLNVGDEALFTIIVRVSDDLTGAGIISNKARVLGDTITHNTGCSEQFADQPCTTDIPVQLIKDFKTWKLVADQNGDNLPTSNELLTYTIHVKNTGNVVINNVLIRDSIPAHTTYVAGSGGTYDAVTNMVTFSFAGLRVKQDTVVRFQVQIANDITNADTIRNIGFVEGDTVTHPTGCSESTANSGCETSIPTEGIEAYDAWKTVVDTDNDGIAQPGESLTYTIHIRNTGNVALSNLLIYDTIPANTTYVPGSGGVLNGARVEFNNVTVPVDDSVLLTFKVNISFTAGDDTRLGNIAFIHKPGDSTDRPTCNRPDGCPEGGGDTTVIPVKKAEFIAWKSVTDANGDNKAAQGEELTYTIHIKNTGEVPVNNLFVFDTIPVHTTYVAGSGGTLNGARVEFSNVNVPVGDSASLAFKVTVNQNVTSSDVIKNIAYTNDGSGGGDKPTCSNPTNCTGGDTTVIPVGPAQFIAWKSVRDESGDGFAQAGEILIYTIHIKNTGTLPITDLLVYDSVPRYTTYVPNRGGLYNETRIVFPFQSIAAGDSLLLNFSVQVDSTIGDVGAIKNIAFIRDLPSEPDKLTCSSPSGCVGGDTTEIPLVPPSFTTWKSVSDANGDGKAQPGEALTYTIHIKNTGGSLLSNLLVYDTIPANTTYVPGSGGVLNGARVEFDSVNVPFNDSVLLSFQVTVAQNLTSGMSIYNIAYVNDGSGNPDVPTCNTPDCTGGGDTTIIPVEPPDFTAWKAVSDANGDGKAQPGEELTYTIHVKNTGNVALAGLLVYDTIPVHTAYVAGSGGTLNGVRVEFSNINIATGDSALLSFKVTILPDAVNAGSIRNIAYVNEGGSGPDVPTCNTPDCSGGDSTVIPVVSNVDLGVLKLASKSSSGIGGTIIGVNETYYYLITVDNAGPNDAHNVVVTDTLAPVLNYGGSSVDKGNVNFDPAARVINWTIDSLKMAERSTMVVTVSAQQAGTVLNTARVISNDSDNNLMNNVFLNTLDILTLKVPNTLTPNGDGKNDQFIISGLELYAENELVIFNRWNNVVFKARNYNNKWDGSGLTSGTYYYVLRVRETNGQWHELKGYIMILR